MEIINGLHNLRSRHRGCVLTIGNFDGVHRGHRQLIDPLREKAKAMGTGNLYGDLIKVTFKQKLREEQAFHSIDALKTQINQDIEQARHYFDE